LQVVERPFFGATIKEDEVANEVEQTGLLADLGEGEVIIFGIGLSTLL